MVNKTSQKPCEPVGDNKQVVDLGAPLSIADGQFVLRNRVVLAPMSGVSDAPFRTLSWQLGAGMVVSEMVASKALVCAHREMQLKARSAQAIPHVIQLAGHEAYWMAEGAKLAQDLGAQMIDINMGCPAKRVTTGQSGSALMRDLDHAQKLIEAVIQVSNVPVSLKMRLGWETHNADELAIRAQQSGVAMITVHGRTRNQFYKGNADWNAVRKVREVCNLPLIINGDIVDHTSATMALIQSGADAVMVGRGSYGVPGLPGHIAQNGTGIASTSHTLILQHFECNQQLYGQDMGIRIFRKHLNWYYQHLPLDQQNPVLRTKAMGCEDMTQMGDILKALFFNEQHSPACQDAA